MKAREAEAHEAPGNGPLRRIAADMLQLPGLRWLGRRLHRNRFARPFGDDNTYHGVYGTYAEADAAARSFATPALPATYDLDAAARAYRPQLSAIRNSDYPLMYWCSRLIAAGERRVFDLGGNIGVTYYGFGKYLEYPADLRWQVHDMPAVMAAGRKWADGHDPARGLSFADAVEQADGADVLLSTGALQYLDYTLPELLQRMQKRPRHVLVNLTPVHPSRGFFTLQNLSFAICPYRVLGRSEFVEGMEALGYRLVDEWQSKERSLAVPFEPGHAVDSYSGFCFRQEGADARRHATPAQESVAPAQAIAAV